MTCKYFAKACWDRDCVKKIEECGEYKLLEAQEVDVAAEEALDSGFREKDEGLAVLAQEHEIPLKKLRTAISEH
ncbi:MAG: hypothetical protein AABX71_00835 [Nanoarchaeota archaeon]